MEQYLYRISQDTRDTLNKRIQLALDHWEKTGEKSEVGHQLYWDPENGFTGDEMTVRLIKEMYCGE